MTTNAADAVATMAITSSSSLDEEYQHLQPHAFHLQLPRHHKTAGGIPYATIDAHRKARYIIKLAENLVLKESFFVNDDAVAAVEANGVASAVSNDDDIMDDGDDENGDDFNSSPTSLHQFSMHCQRLHYQLVKLSEYHYNGGITQLEICQLILKTLGLLCATVEMVEVNNAEEDGVSSLTIEDSTTSAPRPRNLKSRAIIHYDDVGYILGGEAGINNEHETKQRPASTEELLSPPFALPPPVRLSLLNIALHLLGNKKNVLRGVSNSAITIPDDNNSHQRLIVSYHALLRMLLRTAPYLDEHKLDVPPSEPIGTRSSILKKTVSVIRSCRRFFDQKGGASSTTTLEDYIGRDWDDTTARQLWSSLRNDLQFHSHSNSCFRALILLYLFHPSKCSSKYYSEVLPLWMDCWRNVDRCPEWDYLWMVVFSRARKYLPLDNAESCMIWSTLRKHLLSSCKYWLQIPVGGISADKSFPHAKAPGIRTFPHRLKAFVGMGSQYDEGMDFVGKLTKLLMFCTATATTPGDESNDPTTTISEGTSDILRFLSFITPYYNPSNSGGWSFPIGAFLHYLAFELCARVGIMAGLKVLQRDHSVVAHKLLQDDPYLQHVNLRGNEIVALMDGMLPLCQQALYSKNPTISHAGETALLYLAQIDPARVTPPLLDFSMRALDVSSVNLSHQAPAALATLSRLLQPALRVQKDIVLSRLPDILRLSLAGIDGNDQNKSLRTLIFYRNLVMWLPVGGSVRTPRNVSQNRSSVVDSDGNDGTLQIGTSLMATRYSFADSEDYKAAIVALPPNSILAPQAPDQSGMMAEDENETVLMQEAMSAMIDWSQMFLDRIYELLRAAGEQEKLGKGQGGVGMRHTSHDVAMSKNFSRIMKETLTYFFAAMDEQTYEAALHSVTHFLQEETLPFAVKDASLLCQAVCSTRFTIESSDDTDRIDRSPGFDALVSILTEDLHHKSKKCIVYRLRCLSGAVRYAGSAVLKHRKAVTSAISFALSNSDDRVVFKTGCKLLRHVLASQCEEYPIAQCVHPMRISSCENSFQPDLGTSSRLHEDAILWHIPTGEQLDYVVSLLSQFPLTRWKELGNASANVKVGVNLQQWRQTLRVMRYALRGCSGILLDEDIESVIQSTGSLSPKEIATAQLMLTSTVETRTVLQGLRRRLCSNVLDIMCLIAKDTIDCESKTDLSESDNPTTQYKSNEFGPISSDSKILKEVIQMSELLVAKRGAHTKSRNGKTIYRGQKELLADFVLASEAEFLSSVLSRCNDSLHTTINHSKFKDGEDSGKTISRALLVCRINLCCQDLTANASTQVLKRLRRLRGGPGVEAPVSLFSLDMTLQTVQENWGGPSAGTKRSSLELYEAFVDGLCSLACHPNINVRGSALTAVDFTLSRLGWVVKHGNRPSRLLSAISLTDDGQKGANGIPSTAQLVHQVNSQGKRSRLAEVVKGVTKIVAIPRILKHFQWGEMNRIGLVQTLCGNQKLLQLVPPEEVAKLVHYINQIFLALRSKAFTLPRGSYKEQATHEACLSYLLGVLRESKATVNPNSNSSNDNDDDDAGAMHWRDRLVAAWFILTFVDERDLIVGEPKIISQLWTLCSTIIETEVGQPLQRVSLGILGRLVSLSLVDMTQTPNKDRKKADLSDLRVMFSSEKFCRAFDNALVFDHREDSSVSGGHGAQWSTGIEEIICDSTNNIALRTLFPFNRISQKSFTYKVQHSQLILAILLAIGHDNAKTTANILLEHAKELVSSPPSEDQRNQQVTSAEIFGGVGRALIQYSTTEDERNLIWDTMLLPFLGEAVVKMPTNLLGAYFDSCRYCIHHFPPSFFFPLLKWSCTKVQTTLWQHKVNEDIEDGNIAPSTLSDRFTLQGKWILLLQAVIVELDNEDDLGAVCKPPFYTQIFAEQCASGDVGAAVTSTEIELGQSWRHVNTQITPCLLNAIAHPYDKCRDHIASCLFQMCYCHRKFIGNCKASGNGSPSRSDELGIQVIKQLSSVRDSKTYSFKERVRALGTARKFIACCVHWGDAKHEYSDCIIPLLPLTFHSLQTFDDKVSPEDRGIEADLVKGFRYAIADISSSCVAIYGVSEDMTRVLNVLKEMSSHECWQIRQASAHFLRNFQGAHKFLFTKEQEQMSLSIAISLLADDRREVSSAATSTLTGILAMLPQAILEELVTKYVAIVNKSIKKKARKVAPESEPTISSEEAEIKASKERARAIRQQRSVFVLSAVVLGRPYDTPSYIPVILAALSKHSFEQRASLNVREVVKMVCGEYKRTHTDNWEVHRKQFTREQLEALEDVVSIPHYYA